MDFNTRKFPQYSHLIERVPDKGEKKIVICRCWQSKKFPYCDGTHKQLAAAGDSVGPYVAKLRSSVMQNASPNEVTQHTAQRMIQKMPAAAGAAVLMAGIGYLMADILGELSGHPTANLSRWRPVAQMAVSGHTHAAGVL